MLNNQSKLQASAAKPVQVSAQVRGKSAQDIIAEVAVPTQKPVAATAAKGAAQ